MSASYENHRAQLKAILVAWGMPEDNADATADILSWADLHGVDSHGLSMLPGYDRLRRSGRANMAARPRIIKETPVSALVDGDRQGERGRHRNRRGAQLGPLWRYRLLHADGGKGRADRHGVHQRLQHPGGADLRQGSKARHRPLVVRRADR